MRRNGFFTYPASPERLHVTTDELKNDLDGNADLSLTFWPTLNVQGLKIDKLIRERIKEADFLLADITYPNFNVYYELGYCIGCRKPAIPCCNSSIETAAANVNLTGLFDTWGQLRYESFLDLKSQLLAASLDEWTSSLAKPKDHTQPLYFVDMLAKTDFRHFIMQSIANTSISVRKFDPVEQQRLTLNLAVGEITSSAGIIIPLVAPDVIDALRHNLRAAFLAGLAHGYEIEPLIIQFEDKPAPVDFRDFMETTRSRREVEQPVEAYCRQTLVRNQQPGPRLKPLAGVLEKIDLGASNAEREYLKLGGYYVRTAEFSRAVRATGGVIVGRKGSGKSAIFYQGLVEKKRSQKSSNRTQSR
jgi:hypothetical protein